MNTTPHQHTMACRHCGHVLQHTWADLGSAPPSNAYLDAKALHRPERWYPLRVMVCGQCWLVQTEDFAAADQLFDADYAYFSSYSVSWLAHAQRYVVGMANRFQLDGNSQVVEVASNDGYLLQYVAQRGIPCLGVEPTTSTAAAARARGVPTIERFFGTALARELVAQGQAADLTVANNVLAHVPDINDFVAGFATLLKPTGVATFEFPHLLQLVQHGQFDTLYHEHYSYLSLIAVERVLRQNGLLVFDVDTLPTHGGSLRVFARRADGQAGPVGEPVHPRVHQLLADEHAAGVDTLAYYQGFQARCLATKHALLRGLLDAQARGLRVAAYGAAAKGNTLLNFAGVRPDLLPYVVDLNPVKQGKYMPGSRIPIVDEAHLKSDKPDLVLVLPWNLLPELREQLGYIQQWGGRLVTAVPTWELA